MQIQTLPIDKLRPHPQNPRTHPDSAIDKLVKSLNEYGFTNPILVSADNYILAGHARLKAAQKAGLKEVPVITLPLKGNKALAYMIADNRLQEETDWDFSKLTDLLSNLDTGEFDMELTGFDLSEIENLVTGEKAGLTDDDEVPEPKESICKAGDLWILGNHRLLCGDATVEAHVAKLMAGEKADMVFTDPPYGIDLVKVNGDKVGGDKPFTMGGKTGKVGKSKPYRPIEGDKHPFDPSFILTFGIPIILWGGNYCADKLPCKAGWIVWDKRAETTLHRTFADVELAWTSFDKPARIYRHLWDGAVRAGSRQEELATRIHPTQKPVGLFTEILADYEAKDILDLYGGSGSTLIACEKLNRKCYMMEIDCHYCDVIIERWQNFTGKKAVKI